MLNERDIDDKNVKEKTDKGNGHRDGQS